MSVVTMTPEYSGPPACCSLEMIVSSELEEQAAAAAVRELKIGEPLG